MVVPDRQLASPGPATRESRTGNSPTNSWVGALVVSMPPAMVGADIEIAPASGHPGGHHGGHHGHDHGHDHRHDHRHDHLPHVAVVDRPVTHGTLPSLVFPELVEGSYELFDKGEEEVLLTAEIAGGQVAFVEWPTEGSTG